MGQRYRNIEVSFYVECIGPGKYAFICGCEMWVNDEFFKNRLFHYQPRLESPMPKYVIAEVQRIICERVQESMKVFEMDGPHKKRFSDLCDHTYAGLDADLAFIREQRHPVPQRGSHK